MILESSHNGSFHKIKRAGLGEEKKTVGPLFFLIFINDLPLISDDTIFTMFGDDGALTVQHNNLKIAEELVRAMLTRANA